MTKEGQINLVLLGPPGAGKGTLAGFMVKAYRFLHISTGDMLREAVKKGSELGKEIQRYMNSGELVPDKIVTRTVIDRMSKPDAAYGVILDGYPRTRTQAGSLDELLNSGNRSLDAVLYFKTSEEVAVKRLSGRLVCPRCGRNYHVTNIPPKKEGICDTCAVGLIQRADDRPETVRNRFSVYEQRTKDLIAYYEEKGLLREFSGDRTAEQLFEDIDSFLRSEGLIDDDPYEG